MDSKHIKWGLGSSFCSQYNTIYNYWTSKPDATYAGYENTMVSSLVSGGWWSRFDALWIIAAHSNTNSEALTNWINPGTFNASLVGSPAFVQWRGITGDRTNSYYITTAYNPSVDHIHATATSTTIGAYMQHDPALDGDQAYIGCADANELVIYGDLAGAFFSRVNSGSGMTVANTDGSGLFFSTRTTSTATQGIRNGSSLVTDVDYGETFPNAVLNMLRMNGSSGSVSNNEISIGFIMDGVTLAEAQSISTIFNTFMTSIGANTY